MVERAATEMQQVWLRHTRASPILPTDLEPVTLPFGGPRDSFSPLMPADATAGHLWAKRPNLTSLGFQFGRWSRLQRCGTISPLWRTFWPRPQLLRRQPGSASVALSLTTVCVRWRCMTFFTVKPKSLSPYPQGPVGEGLCGLRRSPPPANILSPSFKRPACTAKASLSPC